MARGWGWDDDPAGLQPGQNDRESEGVVTAVMLALLVIIGILVLWVVF